MPSGPKKRKAAKRKNQKKKQDAPSNPSPNPNSQENENDKEKSLVENEEDEDEENFETPRSRPETPMFAFEPNSVYFSIESAKNERTEKMEGLSEAISKGLAFEMDFKDEEPPVVVADAEGSISLVQLDGSSLETEGRLESGAFDYEITHKACALNEKEVKCDDVNSEKGADGDKIFKKEFPKDDEYLKEIKLDFGTPFKENGSVKDDGGSKEMRLDESVLLVEEESLFERVEKLGSEDDPRLIKQSVPFDEEMIPKASIEAVDVSSLNEKEMKDVPWLDEKLLIDDIDEDINVDAFKGGDDCSNKSLERKCNKDDALKETKLDECIHDIEREEKFETEEELQSAEQSVPSSEEMSPKALIAAVDVSSSNEKEVKIVPWPEEEIPAGNGVENVNVDVVNYGKGGADDGVECLERQFDNDDDDLKATELDVETEEDLRSIEQSVPLNEEISSKVSSEAVDDSFSIEKELIVDISTDNGDMIADDGGEIRVNGEFQKDENLEETNLVNLCKVNKQPIPVTVNSKGLLDPLAELMLRRDVDLTNNKLDKSIEKSSVLVDNSVLIVEETSQGSKASHEISESLVDSSDASSHVRVKEAEEPCADAEKTEIACRSEVGRGPMVVRRVTLWNCCGLLEVLTSSDR